MKIWPETGTSEMRYDHYVPDVGCSDRPSGNFVDVYRWRWVRLFGLRVPFWAHCLTFSTDTSFWITAACFGQFDVGKSLDTTFVNKFGPKWALT
jgi:hypothetical protein